METTPPAQHPEIIDYLLSATLFSVRGSRLDIKTTVPEVDLETDVEKAIHNYLSSVYYDGINLETIANLNETDYRDYINEQIVFLFLNVFGNSDYFQPQVSDENSDYFQPQVSDENLDMLIEFQDTPENRQIVRAILYKIFNRTLENEIQTAIIRDKAFILPTKAKILEATNFGDRNQNNGAIV
jgi:hypothetical protein